MAFAYSCFISYRHGTVSPYVERLKADIERELRSNVESPLPVFLDSNRLSAGDKLDATLAQKVCKSMVFIMAYEPTYFSQQSVWCTQELVAFLEHEENRLKEIAAKVPACNIEEYRQLVPVAFKINKFSKIPKDISDRIYLDWSEKLLNDTWEDFCKSTDYRKFLQQVVDRVLNIQMGLPSLGLSQLDTLSNCTATALPPHTDPRCVKYIDENWKRPFPV
jgi:TIR domain